MNSLYCFYIIIFYVIVYFFGGKQARIIKAITPITGTNAIKTHQPLKPASCNLLARIPKEGNKTAKENIKLKADEISPNMKLIITQFKTNSQKTFLPSLPPKSK